MRQFKNYSKNHFGAEVAKICRAAKEAAKTLSSLSTETKNNILKEACGLILNNKKTILQANKIDVENAYKNQVMPSKIERLILDESKIDKIAQTISNIINLPDPINKITYDVKRDNGLRIKRISTPIGVLLVIYESRPNVTSDVASLSIKSGNVAILKSGTEAINTSLVLANYYRQALKKFNISEDAIIFCDNSSREMVNQFLKMNDFIDVVIPRGGKSLIMNITKNTKIPIFKHLDGNCHTYIHEDADFTKARKIIINAKMRRVGICGATESLLIDKKIAKKIIPILVNDLNELGCEIRGEADSRKIDNRIKKASKQDFYTEYLDKILSLKIVNDVEEAISHIAKFGSAHTESIVTENDIIAKEFLQKVNSAIVMHNASTQFADGEELGLGSEVGIATGKLHARGPVGLEQLTIYKYLVTADCGLRK